MCIFSLTSLIACSKPIDKVGYHLEEIKDIDYKLSLKKIDAMLDAIDRTFETVHSDAGLHH